VCEDPLVDETVEPNMEVRRLRWIPMALRGHEWSSATSPIPSGQHGGLAATARAFAPYLLAPRRPRSRPAVPDEPLNDHWFAPRL